MANDRMPMIFKVVFFIPMLIFMVVAVAIMLVVWVTDNDCKTLQIKSVRYRRGKAKK